MIPLSSNLLTLRRHQVEFLVCCYPSMKTYHTQQFRESVSEFLDDYSLHSVIGDLTIQLSNGGVESEHSPRLVRQFLHAFHPHVMLDLQAMQLNHVPDLYLFIARRRNNHQ